MALNEAIWGVCGAVLGPILSILGPIVEEFWGQFGAQFWAFFGRFSPFFGRFGVFWGTGSVFGVSQCPPHCPRCPQGVNTSPGPSWWTWSRGPWTQCARGPLGRSSGPTTSSSVSDVTSCPQMSPPGAPRSPQVPKVGLGSPGSGSRSPRWFEGPQGHIKVPKMTSRSL